MAERQYKKSELTRERLLEVAEEQFAERGFFGARVDEIAEAANINKRMLYAHFGSKDGLYQTVLLKTYERLAECEKQFIVVGLDPIVSIRNIIFVSFKFLSENPNFVRMLLWANLNKGRAVPREALVKLKEPTIDYMRRQIRRGKVMGLFREDADFEILTFILKRDLTTILEVKLQKGHTELSKYTLDELGRKLFLFYLRGISTPRGQQIIEDYLKENEIKIE